MALSQSMEALEKANRFRFAVADKKKELGELDFHAGREALAELILTCEDPALLSGRVTWYLEAPIRTGPQAASRVMRALNIRRHDARLRDLTMRQREVIADAVLNQYRVDLSPKVAA